MKALKLTAAARTDIKRCVGHLIFDNSCTVYRAN
jgi:hypothetical protein